MHVTLLHNPDSGHGRYAKERLLELLRENGYASTYRNVEDGFEDVLSEACDLVVAAGGDGTVGRVAKALLRREETERDVLFAPLPLGTANNTARYLGWHGSPEEIIPMWSEADRRSVDVGVAEGPWGAEFFLEAAGVGLFPRTMSHLSRLKGRREDHFNDPDDELAHDLDVLADALEQQQAAPVHMALDGEDLSGAYLMVEAMNIDAIGPRLRLDPEADGDDGAFEVVVLTEAERPLLRDYLDACAEANAQGREQPDPPSLSTRRGKRLRLHWKGEPLHADSQVWEQDPPEDDRADPAEAPTTVEFCLRAGALQFLSQT